MDGCEDLLDKVAVALAVPLPTMTLVGRGEPDGTTMTEGAAERVVVPLVWADAKPTMAATMTAEEKRIVRIVWGCLFCVVEGSFVSDCVSWKTKVEMEVRD